MPTINATACGSLSPPLDDYPHMVRNGDFDILALNKSVIGDGNNEWTTWKFDFNEDPNFQAFFDSAEELKSAQLTLVLKPKNEQVVTDSVGILTREETPGISIPRIQELLNQKLVVGKVNVVELELIPEFYNSEEILGAFNHNPSETSYRNEALKDVISRLREEGQSEKEGQLWMYYEEDAIIRCALLALRKGDP
jgi:hypothetical protein